MDWLAKKMKESNFPIASIHGDMPQKVRRKSSVLLFEDFEVQFFKEQNMTTAPPDVF